MQKVLDFFFGRKSDVLLLETVSHIDVDRYCQRWYEISTLPWRFSKDTSYTTATYSKNSDGTVKVFNKTLKGGPDGKISSITGKAWATDDTNSKLQVQFFWPLRADYWILKVDKDYKWALVTGRPSGRDYLWILSKTPKLDENVYQELVDHAKGLGFPVEKLERTQQSESYDYDK